MAWYRAGGGGIPSSLKTGMNSVLNKKFGTATTYDPAGWPDDVNLLGKLPEKTVSGVIANLTDGAQEVPIKAWGVTLPASLDGYSEVNGVQTGKNLIDVSTAQGTGTIWFHYDNGIKLKKGATYTFSCGNYGSGSISFYGLDHTTQIAYAYISASSAKVTYTPTEDIIVVPRIYQSGLTVSGLIDVMLEVGSSVTEYEAYEAPTQNTVDLGQTVHGGSVDVVNGTAEPTNWLDNTLTTQTVNGTTFTVNADKSITVSGTPSQQTRVYISQESITINEAMFFSFGTMPTGTRVFCSRTSGGATSYPTISPSHTATLDAVYTNFLLEIGTSFDGTAFTIYPLCNKGTSASDYSPYFEPFTFTPITPTPETALGVNNFWADEGESAVTYRADIDLALGGN